MVADLLSPGGTEQSAHMLPGISILINLSAYAHMLACFVFEHAPDVMFKSRMHKR